MINSNLNNSIPCSTVNKTEQRLDNIEQVLEANKKDFGTTNLTAENANIQNLTSGKQKATSIDVVGLKAQNINVENLDIDGPINMSSLDIADTLTASKANITDATIDDIQSTSVTTANATIDNLVVGQIKAKDSNTLLNDVTVAGTANINKLNLGDPNVSTLNTTVFGARTANIINGNIKTLAGVEDSIIDKMKLGTQISRGDSIEVNMMKILGPSMQIGDKDNQVVIRCDSRPLWNDKVLATLDDLGNKIVPAYKGRLDTEADLIPIENPTLGDYYIITLLTKGEEPNVRTGIGYALYNGAAFDTDFFYELDGYRLAADQDKVDNAQDTAIENLNKLSQTLQADVLALNDNLNQEINDRVADVDDLVQNGVDTHKATNIKSLNLNINDLAGAEYFGKMFTGLGNDWVDGVLPEGTEGATGFCLQILPNSHNTIQVYTINTVAGAKTWKRIFGNGSWSEWRKDLLENDTVENATNAKLLDNNSLLELKQIFFDVTHPVGDTFVSNDGGDDPNTIYNKDIKSTWEYVGQSFGIHGWRRTK